jgi:hypothetical protein
MTMDLEQVPADEQEAAVEDISEVLSQELTKISQAKGLATDTIINTQTDAQVGQRVTTSLDAAYANLIGPDEVVVARGVPGARTVATFGRTREVTDPRTNESIFVAPRPEFQAAMLNAPHSDMNTVKVAYERSGNPAKQFNIHEQLKHLSTLSGDELMQGTANVRLNINLEIAKERDIIRKNAAMQSGLLEAETVLLQNKAMDRAKGGIFLTQSSYQTLQAQALVDQAQHRADRYEASMIHSSPMLAELISGKEILGKTEEWRAKQDYLSAGRREEAAAKGTAALAAFDYKHAITSLNQRELAADRELAALTRQGISIANSNARFEAALAAKAAVKMEKTALLKASVRDEMLTNYHIVYGTTGDDNRDREVIMSRIDKPKEKELFAVLNADPTTVVEMLADDDASIRERGVKLINGWEMNLNAGATPPDIKTYTTAPDGPTAKIARQLLKDMANPSKLVADMKKAGLSDDTVKGINAALVVGDTKEKTRARYQLLQTVMTIRLDELMKTQLKDDVRSWKTSETESGALKDAISAVRTPNGKVPFNDFIDSVFTSPLKNEAGVPLGDGEKVAILHRAIEVATQTAFKSPLYRRTENEALRDQMMSQMNSRMQWNNVQKILTGAYTAAGFRAIFGGPDRNAVGQGEAAGPVPGTFLGAP